MALAFGTVLALTTPGTAFAQETEVAPDSVTVSAINTETDFELSPGETKTVDLSSAESKQSAEISVMTSQQWPSTMRRTPLPDVCLLYTV